MSFHNKFLSLGLIIAAAKSSDGFSTFEKFMINPSNPNYLDAESTAIHQMFLKKDNLRRNLWIILGTQEFKNYHPSIAIKALCKCWDVINNKSNEDKHKLGITNYAHLVEKCEPKYKEILAEIIQAIIN